MKKRHILFKVFNTIWIGALAILFLLPLAWMVSSSLKTGHEVFAATLPINSRYTMADSHMDLVFYNNRDSPLL